MAAITNKRQFFRETLKKIITGKDYEIVNILNVAGFKSMAKPIVFPYIGHDAPPETLESGSPFSRACDFFVYIDAGADDLDTNKDGKATAKLEEVIDKIENALTGWATIETIENLYTNRQYTNTKYRVNITGIDFGTTPSPEMEQNNNRVNALIAGVITYDITYL